MMAGMDDKEDPENTITLEAMSGLSRILSQLDEPSVRQILINICLRIRPCYEKVSIFKAQYTSFVSRNNCHLINF